MSGSEFVERAKAQHRVRRRCRALGVSPSGDWAWRRRAPGARARANAPVTPHIVPIQQASRSPSGALRGQAELAARGGPCGHHRVARLRHRAGLAGCQRRRPVRGHPTRRAPAATPAPELVQRSCTAAAPDQLWRADIPYLPTEQEGGLSVAGIVDVWSRRVLGWAMPEHLRTELVLAARQRAVGHRRPAAGLMHHAEHGAQDPSVLFGQRWAAAGIRSSMGTVGDGFATALVESFFATVECALLTRHRLRTHAEARAAVFDWIEILSHRQRRHSARRYVAPAVDEQTLTTPTPGAA